MRYWSIPVTLAFIGLLCLSLYSLINSPIDIVEGDTKESVIPDVLRSSFWKIWVGALAICQLVLLIRVKPTGERLQARRKLLPAAAAAAFCFMLFFTTLAITLHVWVAGDEALTWLGEGIEWILDPLNITIVSKETQGMWILVGIILIHWLIWGALLWPMTRSGQTDTLIARWYRWLLAGSVIEILVAVPCHVALRRRDECCAPWGTFWGIVTGLSLLCLSLGPAVILLYQERIRKKRAPINDKSPLSL